MPFVLPPSVLQAPSPQSNATVAHLLHLTSDVHPHESPLCHARARNPALQSSVCVSRRLRFFRVVLKRLRILNPRVQVSSFVDSSTLPQLSLSGRCSPDSADFAEVESTLLFLDQLHHPLLNCVARSSGHRHTLACIRAERSRIPHRTSCTFWHRGITGTRHLRNDLLCTPRLPVASEMLLTHRSLVFGSTQGCTLIREVLTPKFPC